MIKPAQQLASACQYLADNDVEIIDVIVLKSEGLYYELVIAWPDFVELLRGQRVLKWRDTMDCMSYKISESISLFAYRLPPPPSYEQTILGD